MTSVLVTGGAGFVGSHVVDRLVETGYNVTVVDNLTDQVHDGKPDHLNEAAEYIWGDVRDRDLMASLLGDADVISHQASAVGVGQSMYEIESYVETNTLGTATLLDIIVNESIDIEKLVVASSMTVYGEGSYRCPACGTRQYPGVRDVDQLERSDWDPRCADCSTSLEPIPTPEEKPLSANTIYAITKRDQEEMSLAVGKTYDIPTVALRYFNIYGSRQSLDNPYAGVGAIFSSRIKNDNPPLLFEDGEQSRDFVHVNDVARANQLAIERNGADFDIVNVGSGTPRTIREVAETLVDLYGKSGELAPELTNEYREGDVRHCFADTTKASDALGFEAEVAFEDGMAELVRWGDDRDATDRFEEAHTELEERGLVGDH